MVPFTRIFTVAMMAVICFVLIVPLALRSGRPMLAAGMAALFLLYLIANVVMWRRMPRR